MPDWQALNWDTAPLRVVEEDADAWQQALIRGQQRRLNIAYQGWLEASGARVECYEVESFSAKAPHDTAAGMDQEGEIWTLCHCDAGQHGRPCQHAALVISHLGWWPFKIASQHELMIPAEHTEAWRYCESWLAHQIDSTGDTLDIANYLLRIPGVSEALSSFLADEIEEARFETTQEGTAIFRKAGQR